MTGLMGAIKYYFANFEFAFDWATVSIDMIVVFLLFRFLLLHRVIKNVKTLDKEIYKMIMKSYLRVAIIGWSFYIAALVVVELALFKPELLEGIMPSYVWYAVGAVLVILGTYIHLVHITDNLISILKQRIELEKGI